MTHIGDKPYHQASKFGISDIYIVERHSHQARTDIYLVRPNCRSLRSHFARWLHRR